jgi:thioester reductase-like protein
MCCVSLAYSSVFAPLTLECRMLQGTKSILQLVATGKRKILHHTSTISVLSDTARPYTLAELQPNDGYMYVGVFVSVDRWYCIV